MLAVVLALLVLPAANTWTVDDDGSADFTQITTAIAQAAPGDTLLVEPGTYSALELTKRLTILGRAGGTRPRVEGLTRVIAESFSLAGLDFDGLRVSEVTARGRIDDCRVGHTGDLDQAYALEVYGCAELVVSRARVKGSKPFSQNHSDLGGSGMVVRFSNVCLVDCLLEGAQGKSPTTFGHPGGNGGTGLTVSEGSHAIIVGSAIRGGMEGWSSQSPFLSCQDGESGTGLEVIGATANVRGGWLAFNDYIVPGLVDGLCTDFKGWGIIVSSGTLVISGVDFDREDVQYFTGVFIDLHEPEPFVSIEGTDAPGGQREIRVHGPVGEPCLLAVSPSPAYAPLGKFTEKLWVGLSGPSLLIPLATTGQAEPLVLTWQVPASISALEGMAIELQPFFPELRST